MAHVSASSDSIASLFISVRIGFEPCNNRYLALSFAMPGPAICFCDMISIYNHGYLSFDPLFSIVASLRAMQCLTLRA